MQTITRVAFALFLLFLNGNLALLIAQPTPQITNSNGVQENVRLAAVKEAEGDYRAASDYLNKAALMESDNKNYAEAIIYYEKSLVLNERINNATGIAGLNSNLAMLHNDLGQYEKALTYFQKTLAVRKARHENEGVFDAMFNISIILKNLNRLDEAIAMLENALDISKETYDYKKMRLCYGTLYEYYDKKGDGEKKMYYFDFYKLSNDLLQGKETKKLQNDVNKAQSNAREVEYQKKIALLEKEMEIKMKDKEIVVAKQDKSTLFKKLTDEQKITKLLSQDNRILEQNEALREAENEKIAREARHKSTQLFYGVIALIIMGALLVFVFIVNLARQRANNTLKAKQRDLKQVNHVKDKMFSIIAHDLRAPFNGIKGLLMLLEQGLLDPIEEKYMLQQLQVTADSTLETLENLLQWAKNQIKGVIPKMVAVNMHEVANNTVKLLREASRQKHITLLNDLPAKGEVMADADHLDIIFRNLISNAIKFTPQYGIVQVSVVQENAHWCITVKDSGVGVPAEKLSRLFEADKNFSTRGTNNEKGTGLGLLLVKELVEKNNGRIEVESTVDKGTTFYITLEAYQAPKEILEAVTA